MVNKDHIMEHAQVTCCGGDHVGIVDHMEGENHIKLAKSDPESGGQHHLIPLSWVKEVKENKVILTKTKDEVRQEWQTC
ncbi:DUF2171 domain-containing protein [Candidatus Sodalis sp. SoCistrobi]|uniref:DUF2171 domain-containing protein n=1 Tax=Candidatus Sodalis sp. SoCistrobi TaxID=1922216 RepID=UPI00093E9BFB|nr:DUF2171 domain-containing protein [Candidatus Sodalis sp. SoCistrobi]